MTRTRFKRVARHLIRSADNDQYDFLADELVRSADSKKFTLLADKMLESCQERHEESLARFERIEAGLNGTSAKTDRPSD